MALEYYQKALTIAKTIGDKVRLSICYTNIGNVMSDKKEYEKATENFLNAIKINQEIEYRAGEAACFMNIGIAFTNQGKIEESLKYYLKSYEISEKEGINNGIILASINISSNYIRLAKATPEKEIERKNKYITLALKFGSKAYELSTKVNANPLINSSAYNLMLAYKLSHEPWKALEFAEVYTTTKDSLFSKEKTEVLTEMQIKYETEKKQQEIEKQQLVIEKQEIDNQKQRIIIYTALGGFSVILIFSLIIVRLFIQKRKANIILITHKKKIEEQNQKLHQANEEINAQKEEIEAQRDLVIDQKNHIEVQKKKIDDSIHYAQRIQAAVLPSETQTKSILGEHFVIFRPKDIVSGDFYWYARVKGWLIIALADCTGHGIPGAFMSMLGISFLNEVVRKKEIINPAQILTELRKSVIDALNQNSDIDSQKDGMEISILAVETTTRKSVWAGAGNPLWILRKNPNKNNSAYHFDLVEELKPDNMPIAFNHRMNDFSSKELQLFPGDQVYLISDGIVDQFGGPEGKKFQSKQLKSIIVQNASLPLLEQKKMIEQALDEWQCPAKNRCFEQVDDITILGVKI